MMQSFDIRYGTSDSTLAANGLAIGGRLILGGFFRSRWMCGEKEGALLSKTRLVALY